MKIDPRAGSKERVVGILDIHELAEEMNVEIVENYKDYNHVHCQHAFMDSEQKYRIPKVIKCYNEGGYNSTALCVDCLRRLFENRSKSR